MKRYRFEEIAENSTKKKKPTEEDKYTYIGLEHLDSESLEVKRYGSDIAPIGEKLIMQKGDILFGKRRAYQKKVGIAPFDGIFSAHGLVLRPKEELITKEFFPFFISSDYFLDKAIKISVGSLSPTINWSDLKKLEFEIPEKEEQIGHSKILWAMEDLKRSYEVANNNCNAYIKSKFYKSINEVKKTYIKLGDICNPKQWKTISTKNFSKEGYPVYGANGLIGYYTEYNHENPTLMIGCRGTCGVIHLSEGKCYINGNAMCLENLSDKVDIYFLEMYLKNYDFTRIITGASQPQIIATTLKEIELYLPNIIEQKRIVNSINNLYKVKKEIEIALDLLIKSKKEYINKKCFNKKVGEE